MTLRQWLKHTGTEPAAFAALLGVHWVTVYKWASGSARPGFDKMKRIEEITAGQVTARSLAHEANEGAVTPQAPIVAASKAEAA